MKLKLTDSPGIAGVFYWFYQKGLSPIMGYRNTLKELFFEMILVIRPSAINENSRFL